MFADVALCRIIAALVSKQLRVIAA